LSKNKSRLNLLYTQLLLILKSIEQIALYLCHFRECIDNNI
jgi:hypothetical protein